MNGSNGLLKINTIFWDFDGTLAYRDGMWTGTLMDVLEKNSIQHIQKEDLRPFLNIGFSWHSPETSHELLFAGKDWWQYYNAYFSEIFQKVGVKTKIANELALQVKEEFINPLKWHLYSDTKLALKNAAKAGFRNVILSNHIPELKLVVKNLGIDEYFLEIYSSANIGYEKPNLKIFNFVLKNLNLSSGECIMIGDSYEADIAGALRADIKPILVRNENGKSYKWFSPDLINVNTLINRITKISVKGAV